MKKILYFVIFLLNISILFTIDFINIPSSDMVSIGSNKFIYFEDYYLIKPEKLIYRYPEKIVKLDSYLISKYLVSNEQFNKFLIDTKYDLRGLSQSLYWKDYFNTYKTTKKHFVLADFYEGMMFCQWLSKKTKKTIRFPTNAEWEYATMKNNKSIYPWGCEDGFFKSIAAVDDKRLCFLDLGSIPEDVSPFGIEGMFGGPEYIMDSFDEKNYDDFKNNVKNPLVFSNSSFFSIRSGDISYNEKRDNGFGLFFHNIMPFYSLYSSSIGFRLVEDNGTIFNQGELDECLFFQNRGKINTVTQVYFKPDSSYATGDVLNENFEVLTLFQTSDENWLRVLYEKENVWLTGWIASSSVLLSSKPWYEDPL